MRMNLGSLEYETLISKLDLKYEDSFDMGKNIVSEIGLTAYTLFSHTNEVKLNFNIHAIYFAMNHVINNLPDTAVYSPFVEKFANSPVNIVERGLNLLKRNGKDIIGVIPLQEKYLDNLHVRYTAVVVYHAKKFIDNILEHK